MEILQGDILNVTSGVICHQVNCSHVMGAGLAAAIRKKYPRHYADYVSRVPHLGGLVFTQVNSNLYIVGIYGQLDFGQHKQQTDYEALEKGLIAAGAFAKSLGLPIYLPYGIGCGLAGGDWDVVSKIIERVLPSAIIIQKTA